MQHYLLCSFHVGMNFENTCVLLISHVPSKALLEVFFLLQGISLDDSNVTCTVLKTYYTGTDT